MVYQILQFWVLHCMYMYAQSKSVGYSNSAFDSSNDDQSAVKGAAPSNTDVIDKHDEAANERGEHTCTKLPAGSYFMYAQACTLQVYECTYSTATQQKFHTAKTLS